MLSMDRCSTNLEKAKKMDEGEILMGTTRFITGQENL